MNIEPAVGQTPRRALKCRKVFKGMTEGGRTVEAYEAMSPGLAARLSLQKHEFHFTHALGQNFILDDGLMRHIVEAADVRPGENVLEIGAGAGVLTRHLAEQGARVTAVEVDDALKDVLGDVLGNLPVRLVFGDALKLDYDGLMGEEPYCVVANLPYYVTADVLLKLLRTRNKPRRIAVMVQREAADRIAARPGVKAWCALSATVAYYGQAERLFEVPPHMFTPPPHVVSEMIMIRLYEPDRAPCVARSESMMMRVIAAAFAMRRKTLQNNLCAAFDVDRERAARWLNAVGLPPQIRGEALSIEQMAALSDVISDDASFS